jgi:hypothetical protein
MKSNRPSTGIFGVPKTAQEQFEVSWRLINDHAFGSYPLRANEISAVSPE